MWHAMFAGQIPLAEKILRTAIVYGLLAVLFRLTGKQGLASMNTLDFVAIFLLSSVAQNAVIGNDTSLIGGIIGAVTLVTVNTAVNRLIAASTTVARIFDGHATTVISDGHAIDRALRRLGLRRSELDLAVRLQNGDDIAEVDRGSLEPGGQLVLTLKSGEGPPRLMWPSSPASSARIESTAVTGSRQPGPSHTPRPTRSRAAAASRGPGTRWRHPTAPR
jgi:uncharacterized membrane protein YcaP (DUF421 family)